MMHVHSQLLCRGPVYAHSARVSSDSVGIAARCRRRQPSKAPRNSSAPPDRMSCSEFITSCLVEAGVREVYGGHGGALVPLVNAVCDNPDLTWVCTRNETNASLMAAAAAKLSNGRALGACISTSGQVTAASRITVSDRKHLSTGAVLSNHAFGQSRCI